MGRTGGSLISCVVSWWWVSIGLPVGAVRYEVSREVSPEAVYRTYWKEVAMITEGGEDATEKKLSTTLLILPNFGLRNCEAFEV